MMVNAEECLPSRLDAHQTHCPNSPSIHHPAHAAVEAVLNSFVGVVGPDSVSHLPRNFRSVDQPNLHHLLLLHCCYDVHWTHHPEIGQLDQTILLQNDRRCYVCFHPSIDSSQMSAPLLESSFCKRNSISDTYTQAPLAVPTLNPSRTLLTFVARPTKRMFCTLLWGRSCWRSSGRCFPLGGARRELHVVVFLGLTLPLSDPAWRKRWRTERRTFLSWTVDCVS